MAEPVSLIQTEETTLRLLSRSGLPSVVQVEISRRDRFFRPCYTAHVEVLTVGPNGEVGRALDSRIVTLSEWTRPIYSIFNPLGCVGAATLNVQSYRGPVIFRVLAPEDQMREIGRSVPITLNAIASLPSGGAIDEIPGWRDTIGGAVGSIGTGMRRTAQWIAIGAVGLAVFAFSDEIKAAINR